MRIAKFHLVIIVFMIFSVVSCVKPEGYGGTSNVKGKIITKYYNDDYSLLVKEEPAVDEEVFLMFGSDENLGDRTFTSVTGSFEFPYLRPGSYTLYFMTEDSTGPDRSEQTKTFEFELKNGQDLDLGTLVEYKTLDFDEGSAKIYGVVRLVNYKNTSVFPFMEVKDTSYAQEQEMYLIYGEHKFYDERIRTSYNGYFEFPNLIPGNYEVFTYSEDISGGTERIRVHLPAIVTDTTTEIDLGVLLIEQL